MRVEKDNKIFILDKADALRNIIIKHTNTGRSKVVDMRRSLDQITFLKKPQNANGLERVKISDFYESVIDDPDLEIKEIEISGINFRRNALYRRFDGKPLSIRSEAFQTQVANMFVEDVLLEDVNEDVAGSDSLKNKLGIARLILEREEHLQGYLKDTQAFLAKAEENLNISLSNEERIRFEQSANNQTAIYSLFDYVQLGEAMGDGDTYILVGTSEYDHAPTSDTMMWLQKNLAEFMDQYGYLPGYGSYVTEATLRQRVVLGPDVTEQEANYIANNVFDVYDCRDGQSIISLDLD